MVYIFGAVMGILFVGVGAIMYKMLEYVAALILMALAHFGWLGKPTDDHSAAIEQGTPPLAAGLLFAATMLFSMFHPTSL